MAPLTAVVLTAGEGKRMRSRRPKVLHQLCGRPLLGYALRTAQTVTDRVVLVVGPDAADVVAAAGPGVEIIEQRERLGTADAVRRAERACGPGRVLVMPGDVPLMTAATVEGLLAEHARVRAGATLLTAVVDAPTGYGRVVRVGGRVAGIVEERDATDDQKKIREINTGVYVFDGARLWAALGAVRPDNAPGEYYLTDTIAIIARAGGRVAALSVADPEEALGVNDRRQLAAVAAIQRRRILERLMQGGVTVVDPGSTWVDDTVRVGPETVLHPQVTLAGQTTLGADCVVAAGCHLTDASVGDGVTLRPYCVLDRAVVEPGAALGPFCHLRPGSHVGEDARIGNFVELKQSRIGRGAKVPHLSYVGDATVGEAANIGAGAITCNYDGTRKHQTVIGPGAFVGTNASLVAPVTIGEGAYVGAGSTITKDVPPGALAVGRGRQVTREGWAARRRRQLETGGPGETGAPGEP